MMDDYLACRAEYPEMSATWQRDFGAVATETWATRRETSRRALASS